MKRKGDASLLIRKGVNDMVNGIGEKVGGSIIAPLDYLGLPGEKNRCDTAFKEGCQLHGQWST